MSANDPKRTYRPRMLGQTQAALPIDVMNSAALKPSTLLTRACCYCGLNLRFHLLHIEAGSFLHRRKLHKALRRLRYLLLHQGEPPKLKDIPIVKGERTTITAG